MGAIGCQQGLALPCLTNRVATEGKRSDFLVATSLDELLFLMKMLFTFFIKQATLKRRSAVLSHSLIKVTLKCTGDYILMVGSSLVYNY
jgi:hypothetical protein